MLPLRKARKERSISSTRVRAFHPPAESMQAFRQMPPDVGRVGLGAEDTSDNKEDVSSKERTGPVEVEEVPRLVNKRLEPLVAQQRQRQPPPATKRVPKRRRYREARVLLALDVRVQANLLPSIASRQLLVSQCSSFP